jgi:glyoxylase-like metal-dependent hydrolase (beta-lactamase superfamily II)
MSGLDYATIAPPPPGQSVDITPNIRWVRMDLPFPPSHVNCWLLREQAGWTVVDTGANTTEIRSNWQQIFATQLDGLPIIRVVCTHHHIDHVGLAGWFCETWQAPLLMTRTEWLTGRLLPLQWSGPKPEKLAKWDHMIGLPETVSDDFWKVRVKRSCWQALPLPDSFIALSPEDTILVRGSKFRILTASGHSPEPMLLFDPASNVLISGDQVLPRITPHIGVDYMEPHANPLGLYLHTLGKFKSLPENTLVLPSHGAPFYGLHGRLQEVADHHEDSMARILAACADSTGVQRLVPIMFNKTVKAGQLALATQECMAHLRYLEAGRYIRQITDQSKMKFITDKQYQRNKKQING